MIQCRGVQAWSNSRSLENEDTRCSAEEFRHRLIRKGGQADTRNPWATKNSPMAS